MKKIAEIGVFIFRVLLLSEISLKMRINLILGAYFSIFTLIFHRQKRVKYFGHDFIHESIVGPVLIYPHEISTDLIKQTSGERLKYVLDIGGNLGQFAITLVNMMDLVQLDIVEPNPTIFNTLKSNTSFYKQISCYNFAIGKPGIQKFYYKKGKSATGSFIKSNAYLNEETTRTVKVEVVNKIQSHTKRSNYDLIKIDVEGFEMEVVKNLKGIKTKYLLIEVSSNREKNYSTSELYSQIAKTFGEFEIVYQDASDSQTNSFDVLLRF
ncbi:FkbM family methyltransferase [Candidatus Dojkabacteria bacterium]|jgi:FkbM family methyltransferase|uniref:FkbM family methyltransferase n=1 Tax=Candidatus Dojkabacteria bacterium TaxID=2099670 RepID=A0A955I7F4_9BACT|nr:FkbM family methyltransferase [Candidatus Dojkabacteria bacterium]